MGQSLGKGSVGGGAVVGCVFVGRSSLLFLLCGCQKECSEMLRVFRYSGGGGVLVVRGGTPEDMVVKYLACGDIFPWGFW